jgi:hypothetical protein
MGRERLLSLVAVAGLASAVTLGVQEITRTYVVNLKDPHPIQGTVEVPEPVPHARLERMLDVVVGPSTRGEPNLWAEAGVLETDGFTSVVLSLHGQLRGIPGSTGAVGLILVPDEETIQQSLVEGEVHLALEAVAEPVPAAGLYFSGTRSGLPVAFPRYRVFVYNTTDRSASVNVFAYLVN